MVNKNIYNVMFIKKGKCNIFFYCLNGKKIKNELIITYLANSSYLPSFSKIIFHFKLCTPSTILDQTVAKLTHILMTSQAGWTARNCF